MVANAKKGVKGFQPIPLEQRFWQKVERLGPSDCWPWKGSVDRDRGTIWVEGRLRKAPQVAWELYNGAQFPEGKMACHSCDNPLCCNPAHIWAGTMSDNIKDCVSKGRHSEVRKTHCLRGHELAPGNLKKSANGHRICRQCALIRSAELRAKRRAARAALRGEP